MICAASAVSPLSSTSSLSPCLQAATNHSSCENRSHTKVPRGFSPSTRLLDLRGNHFHYIPSSSFPGVAKVVSLHLQRCKIVEVEDGAFSGMKGLIYLYLSENDLTSLSPNALKGGGFCSTPTFFTLKRLNKISIKFLSLNSQVCLS